MEPELSIGILPEFRARGIGGQLLDALLSMSRSRVCSVALSVRADNPAVRLYRRIGFKEIGRTENRVGGSSLVMRCEMAKGVLADGPRHARNSLPWFRVGRGNLAERTAR
jgi:predicted GNAT family N-acyltransferase